VALVGIKEAAVTVPLKVLFPAKVCGPVETPPGNEFDAGCILRLFPARVSPLALAEDPNEEMDKEADNVERLIQPVFPAPDSFVQSEPFGPS